MPSEADLDLSGVLGIDFVNTGSPVASSPGDFLETPDDLLSWLALAGGDELARLAPSTWPERRSLTREARALRAALRAVFAAVATGEPPPPASTFIVDRALRATRMSFSLSPPGGSGPGPARDHRSTLQTPPVGEAAPMTAGEGRSAHLGLLRTFEGGGPLAVLTPIALSAIEITATADPDRLRSCDAPGCGRWFLDTSRGGQRRWCSMDRCGNRMKAARYRARQQAEGG